jgi:hypothetical protein
MSRSLQILLKWGHDNSDQGVVGLLPSGWKGRTNDIASGGSDGVTGKYYLWVELLLISAACLKLKEVKAEDERR